MNKPQLCRICRAAIALILLLGVLGGAFWRGQIPDCGLAEVKSVSSVYALTPTLATAMGENPQADEALLQLLQSNPEQLSSYLENATVIAQGTALDACFQTGDSFVQYVHADRVVRGDAYLAKGEVFALCRSTGFVPQNGGVAYNSVQNVLLPGESYLIFAEPSELNEEASEKSFYILAPLAGCIPIDGAPTPTLFEPFQDVTFESVQSYAFFSTSPALTAEINDFEAAILEETL